MKAVIKKVRIPAAFVALWATVCLCTGNGLVAILRRATGTDEGDLSNFGVPRDQEGGGTNLIDLVNNLLGDALLIALVVAPLAMAWGAGQLFFSGSGGGAGGNSGGSVIAASVLAVVLIAAARGLAY